METPSFTNSFYSMAINHRRDSFAADRSGGRRLHHSSLNNFNVFLLPLSYSTIQLIQPHR